MDHDHDHDHGAMDNSTDVVCKMNMAFHWGACEFILFKSWQANSVPKFVAACIVFFVLAFLYEGLKYYRELLFVETQKLRQTVVKMIDSETAASAKMTIRQQMLNVPHFYQTFLHLGQVFISYILMLIVMLCNLNLILAIVLGAAFGYFTFGWLRKLNCGDTNECCY